MYNQMTQKTRPPPVEIYLRGQMQKKAFTLSLSQQEVKCEMLETQHKQIHIMSYKDSTLQKFRFWATFPLKYCIMLSVVNIKKPIKLDILADRIYRKLKRISFPNCNIITLEHLSRIDAPFLTSLNLSHNKICSMPPLIKFHPSLQQINLHDNFIIDFDRLFCYGFSQNKIQLYCDGQYQLVVEVILNQQISKSIKLNAYIENDFVPVLQIYCKISETIFQLWIYLSQQQTQDRLRNTPQALLK